MLQATSPNTRKRQRTEDNDDGDSDSLRDVKQSKKIKNRSSIGETIYNTATTIVNTAAEAVVLVTILGMAAYKIWNGKEEQPDHQDTQSKQDTSQDNTDTPRSARRQELPPPYEAVYYQSPYKMNESISPRRSSSTPKRSQIARSARRRVAVPATRQAVTTSSTTLSSYSTPSILPGKDEEEDDDDEFFNNMSSRLQSLIQQGTEALASPTSSHYSSPSSSSLSSSNLSERSISHLPGAITAKDRRKSLPAPPTLIPSPSHAKHRPRLSKS